MAEKSNSFIEPATIPAWWKSTFQEISHFLSTEVRTGSVSEISYSPGGRKVYAVEYGEKENHLKGTANFNSALGGRKLEAYFDKAKRQKPVLVVIGGIHGHEVEGMVATLSLINIIEKGISLDGHDYSKLQKQLQQLRVIIIPLANPDGRERCPYSSWVGNEADEMTKYGQGTRKNGELYRWAPSKAVHPMRGDVGILGCYFDDNGVNMMHDNWANPMSATTKVLLELVDKEGPDCLINLHSDIYPPDFHQVQYTPYEHQLHVYEFASEFKKRLEAKPLTAGKLMVHPDNDNANQRAIPAALNLQSMFYHVGSSLNILYESTHGIPPTSNYDHADILLAHHVLFEVAADKLLAELMEK